MDDFSTVAKSVGTDLLNQQRVEKVMARHGERFAQRILTPAESEVWQERGLSINFIAKRFAAKEAVAKALGTGIAKGVGFQQIQVVPDELGKPCVELFDEALERAYELGGSKVLLSLSDEGEMILAFAVLV